MPTTHQNYQLRNDDSPVTVEFAFGHGSTAETVIRLTGIPQNGTFRDSFDFSAGPCQKLHGEWLVARSYAAKMPGQNTASLTVKVTGGVQDAEYKLLDDSPNNPAIFVATIDFFI